MHTACVTAGFVGAVAGALLVLAGLAVEECLEPIGGRVLRFGWWLVVLSGAAFVAGAE
ncbi:hypothetical protein [Nocardia jiangxiensis]|uniref:hypothetical protein n=1 Tax=Nocardia jiangxiensis TaxID=282685 RepID=UPI0002E5ED93|nr:hypothetical protein [Nocardia jiangxiensis]